MVGVDRVQRLKVLSRDWLVCYAFLAFLARRFSLRVLPATFFELLPPLSLFAIGVLHTGDRSGNRETIVSHPYTPQRNPVRNHPSEATHIEQESALCAVRLVRVVLDHQDG